MIRNEWGYECYFNSYKSNSRGVAILINNNFEIKIKKEKKDLTGNILALDIELDYTNITLINIYGPNEDNPVFYDTISEIIDNFGNDHIILCGDFNLVLNPVLDYDVNYRQINNPKAREKVLEHIETYGLVDIFREHHEDIKRYTWRKHNPLKQARLDFFLVSENLLSSSISSNIEPGYRSDHSNPKIVLKLNKFKKGKGLWKMNNSLLHDKEYLDLINKYIVDIKLQYSLPVYNPEYMNTIPDSVIEFTISDQLFLEILLLEIRGKTISYSSFI